MLESILKSFVDASITCKNALVAYSSKYELSEISRFHHPYYVLFGLIGERKESSQGIIYLDSMNIVLSYRKHGLGFTFTSDKSTIQFNLHPFHLGFPGIWMSPYSVLSLSNHIEGELSIRDVDLFLRQQAIHDRIIRNNESGVYMANEVSPEQHSFILEK